MVRNGIHRETGKTTWLWTRTMKIKNMKDGIKALTVTVQGRGYPSTGPPVDPQAGALKKAIEGIDKDKNVQEWVKAALEKTKDKPRLRLRCDLPEKQAYSAPSSPTMNVAVLDLTWDEDEARSVKKRRYEEESSETPTTDTDDDVQAGEEKLATKIRKVIKTLDKDIRTLVVLTGEKNIKGEIKEMAVRLRSLMSQIMTNEAQAILQKMGKAESDTIPVNTTVKQVEYMDTLQQTERLYDFTKLEKKEWTDKVYTNTEIIVGNPVTAEDKLVKVVITEPDNPTMEKSIQKIYRDRFPELLAATDEFEVIEQMTRIRSKGPAEYTKRKIIKTCYNGTEEDIWMKLIRIKEETAEDKKSGCPPHRKDGQQEITENDRKHFPCLKTRTAGPKPAVETIHIRGIDATTLQEEVTTAIEGEIGSLEGKTHKVSKLRPSANNTQAVTISLEKTEADKILNKGKIRIGIVNCTTEKRIDLKYCRRCWSYQHATINCDGPDRSKLCFRCGKEGHSLSACKNKETCLLCSTDGHRMGGSKCGAFTQALRQARKARVTEDAVEDPNNA
ncbi:hypothetical protein NQ318_023531 [Aromia moschata]|uniref:CCHC-type domain-containing protein n=1 Tax=Aromia moschata TaxID=1265417 RepID=A0AAV8YN93_9CUCU|nr:hypothetical protein NQ318_023531 [Aromia moschata]